MLQLYYDPSCPFCQRVLNFFDEKNVDFERKEMSLRQDSPVKSELRELSGRTQVPFLVDTERDIKMPESQEIIDYVDQHYVQQG